MKKPNVVMTPLRSVAVHLWLRTIPVGDVAFILGCCSRVIAEHQKISEAELFADFAKRAAADPDASKPARR